MRGESARGHTLAQARGICKVPIYTILELWDIL